MAKIDIFSGFLGAGKTTLIKKLLTDVYKNQQIVIIENEFGQIGIDGGFLKESGIQITEMNSGCICCSLVGDFGKALTEVIDTYNPDRIIIEPSGVGKLSDVIAAVSKVPNTEICATTTVADASKLKIYLKNFKEFYENQIESASTIILSRTQNIKQEKLDEAMALIRSINTDATVITTPWDDLDGQQIFDAMMKENSLVKMADELLREHEEHEEHHHHHHHDDDDEECECGCHHHHHHDDDDDDDDHDHECCHHHHHHDDDDDDHECCCHHHHHDDDDDDHECCHHDHEHEHHHHHHHGHDADEVFDSIGFETSKTFAEEQVFDCLDALKDTEKYGLILRAKGILPGNDGNWIHFDFVPDEINVRRGSADVIGKLCVIGSNVNKSAIKELFNL